MNAVVGGLPTELDAEVEIIFRHGGQEEEEDYRLVLKVERRAASDVADFRQS